MTKLSLVLHAVIWSAAFFQPAPDPVPVPVPALVADIAATDKGALTILDAAGSTGATSYAWRLIPDDPGFEVVDGGKRACFAPAKPGVYHIVLAVGGKDGAVAIDVEEVLRGPSPGPGPDPGPRPVDLSALALDWTAGVTSTAKKAEAVKVANAFATVASQIAAGALESKPEVVLKATKAGYESALGAALSKWKPFFDKLSAHMNERDTGDYVAQWNAIADGLGKVK